MKRFILITSLCLMAISINAQTEHVKFMGIPLNGTITQFQQKLQAKGVRYDQVGSREIGSGIRKFTGNFAGMESEIYVYYDDKTKIVYRAKAVIQFSELNHAKSKLEDYKYMLKEKYLSFLSEEGEQDGYPTFLISIADSNYNDIIGNVSLYMSDYLSYYYFLHIDYYDSANYNKHENKVMDDL